MQQWSFQESETPIYDQSDCPFCPGDLVVISGIYGIGHRDEPRVRVLLVRQSIFPLCRRCGDEVRYRLLQPAPHISEDPDFVESITEPDISPATDASLYISPVQPGFGHDFCYSQYLQARREDS